MKLKYPFWCCIRNIPSETGQCHGHKFDWLYLGEQHKAPLTCAMGSWYSSQRSPSNENVNSIRNWPIRDSTHDLYSIWLKSSIILWIPIFLVMNKFHLTQIVNCLNGQMIREFLWAAAQITGHVVKLLISTTKKWSNIWETSSYSMASNSRGTASHKAWKLAYGCDCLRWRLSCHFAMFVFEQFAFNLKQSQSDIKRNNICKWKVFVIYKLDSYITTNLYSNFINTPAHLSIQITTFVIASILQCHLPKNPQITIIYLTHLGNHINIPRSNTSPWTKVAICRC